MASRDIKDCVPSLQAAYAASVKVWKTLYPAAPVPVLTCTNRPGTEQDELYAQGRTKPGKIVTNAAAGQSKHNFMPSKALDVAFKNPDGTLDWSLGNFQKFAVLMKDHGIRWGGDFRSIPDSPHFEVEA